VKGKNVREFAEFSSAKSGLGLDELLDLVSEHTGLRPEEILRGKFQRVLARKAALYLARRFTGLTLREIGEAFGVDYTTVHMAARRVEELRAAEPGVDGFLQGIENELRARSDASGAPEEVEAPAKKRERRPRPAKEPKGTGQLKLF
jgi:hypothetical protein